MGAGVGGEGGGGGAAEWRAKGGQDRYPAPRKRRPQPRLEQQRFGDGRGVDQWEEGRQADYAVASGEEEGRGDGGYGGGVTSSSDTQEEVPPTYYGAGAEQGRGFSAGREEAGVGAGVGVGEESAAGGVAERAGGRSVGKDVIPRAVMLLIGNGFLLMYAFSIETIYAMFLKVFIREGRRRGVFCFEFCVFV